VNGEQMEKLDDVNWIESTKDMSSDTLWCFMIRVCFNIDCSSLSVKFLVFRNLKYVDNFGLLKYHTKQTDRRLWMDLLLSSCFNCSQ